MFNSEIDGVEIFRFAHPEYLYGLILLPLFFLAFLLVMRWKARKLSAFADRGLLPHLMPDINRGRQVFKYFLLLLALGFLILGAADPQIGSRLEKGERKGIDLFICLDVSNSMLAEDIKPTRLDRAKNAVSKMVDELKNDRIGIVVFAGKAYVQLPITTDYAAAKLFLSTLSPDMIPSQGTAIGEAINLAVESFDDNRHSKAIILITDGENHEDDALEAAKLAASGEIRVFTIGMGLPDGAPVPVYRNGTLAGFKKDSQGNTIISKLDDALLEKIAAAGQGTYVRASNTQSGLEKIFREINTMQKTEFEARTFADYEDRFQAMLAVALLLLVAELLILERRNKVLGRIKLFG